MDQTLLKNAVGPLLVWFRANKRELPWRKERTPYSALVAELMLQQTRVEAVKERYVEFVRRFPTAEALASASEDEVLKAWEGLGYYSRARNLHAAAKIIAREGFPQTFEGVRALPGVGDYTAGAVCSIALGFKTPAVDGNVVRVLSRLFADGAVADTDMRKRYSALLKEVYPPEAGEFTEALMELGAIVCLPNGAPLCEDCPWNALCSAHAEGKEESYPIRAEKRERRIEERDVFVLKCGEKYALQKRGKGLLSGMWEFPNGLHAERQEISPLRFASVEMTEGASTAMVTDSSSPIVMSPDAKRRTSAPDTLNEVQNGSARSSIVETSPCFLHARVLETKRAKHVFTHVEWRMTGYLIETKEELPQFLWASAEEIKSDYAVPSAFKAFSVWLR